MLLCVLYKLITILCNRPVLLYLLTHIHKYLNIHAVDTNARTSADNNQHNNQHTQPHTLLEILTVDISGYANNNQLFCSAAIAKSNCIIAWELHQCIKLTVKHHNKSAVVVGHKNPTFGCRDGIKGEIIYAGGNAMCR